MSSLGQDEKTEHDHQHAMTLTTDKQLGSSLLSRVARGWNEVLSKPIPIGLHRPEASKENN
jgi:hypothetical protein